MRSTLCSLGLLLEGWVLPSCLSWLITPLGGLARCCSGFNDCSWGQRSSTCSAPCPRLVSETPSMAPVALLQPVAAYLVGAEWQPRYQQGFYSLVPSNIRGWSLLPPLSFQTDVLGLIQPCDLIHAGINHIIGMTSSLYVL